MTVLIRETMTQEVGEGGNAVLTCYFEGTDGLFIPVAGISTLRFWLDNLADGATINSRTNQEIKNLNGGTLVEVQEIKPGGSVPVTRTKLTLLLAPADNPIVDATRRLEYHLGTARATYNGGAGSVPKEFLIKVRNLSRTP